MSAALFILVFWVIPVVAGTLIGDRKDQRWQGFICCLFLGWLGVIFVALWKAKPPEPPGQDAVPPGGVAR